MIPRPVPGRRRATPTPAPACRVPRPCRPCRLSGVPRPCRPCRPKQSPSGSEGPCRPSRVPRPCRPCRPSGVPRPCRPCRPKQSPERQRGGTRVPWASVRACPCGRWCENPFSHPPLWQSLPARSHGPLSLSDGPPFHVRHPDMPVVHRSKVTVAVPGPERPDGPDELAVRPRMTLIPSRNAHRRTEAAGRRLRSGIELVGSWGLPSAPQPTS